MRQWNPLRGIVARSALHILVVAIVCGMAWRPVCVAAADDMGMDNALRINTDLTAGVIDGGVRRAGADEAGALGMGFGGGDSVGKHMTLTSAMATATAMTGNATALAEMAMNRGQSANVCVREESYVEQLRVPVVQPVRIRTSNWCMEFPPRCSNYKTEMREVIKIQNITKTRTIRYCCPGYEGNISITDTVCKPVCLGGCGRGYCQQPDVCSCEAGYTGKHCTQRCDHDHWGMRCQNECQCRNGAVCDNKSGLCHCTTGWTGEFCELPCPTGTYGVMCRKACECVGNGGCHPQNGACEHAPNATHAMIETLNSTIANITHNLDRLAQNIVNIVTTAHPLVAGGGEKSDTATTNEKAKPVPEVIVIKQADAVEHTAPKIIVHGTSADLLENIHHAAAMGSKSGEVIHVIAGWPGASAAVGTGMGHINLTHAGDDLDLASFARDSTAAVAGVAADGAPRTNAKSAAESGGNLTSSDTGDHETSVLMLLLFVLLIVLVAVAGSFLYVYRRYQVQQRRVEAVLSARNSETFTTQLGTGAVIGGGGGSGLGLVGGSMLPPELSTLNGLEAASAKTTFPKPLPDLPAFTQQQSVRHKIDEPEFYDSPSNNSSIKTTPSYTSYGRKESLYSLVKPKSRKGSQESHLYDEIRYHTPSPTPTLPMPSHSPHSHQHLQLQHNNKMPNVAGATTTAAAATATIYVPTNGPTAVHTLAGNVMPHAVIQQQQQQQQQPTQTQHHISQLIIQPAAHTNYLQVPQMLQRQSSQTSNHKVAHL